MKPHLVKFYLYAEDEADIQGLQDSLYDLVTSCYNEGIYVTASKLGKLLKQYGTNPLTKQLFK